MRTAGKLLRLRVGWLVAATALLGSLVVAPAAQAKEGSRCACTDLVGTSKGAIASVHPLASQIGIDVLDNGGNAIDAAVAVAFALGVVRPEMTGPGGGGFMVYRSADGSDVATLDFRETAPGDVTDATFRQGAGIDDFSYLFYSGAGHRVVGVPGNVAGLAAALERYGTISLAAAIAPAKHIAEQGFIVSGELQNYLFFGIPYLRLFPETAKVFLHDTVVTYPRGPSGSPTDPFDPALSLLFDNTGKTLYLKQPDHAKTLGLIAEHGPDAFYRGDIEGNIAEKLVADFAKSGSLYPGDAAQMTMKDLAAYRPIWREPIRTNYRGHQIIGMPPPASGGVLLAEVLNILEGFDLASFGPSSADHLHYLNEAMKIALADRLEHLADPDFEDVPVRWLTSRRYANERRSDIKQNETQLYGPEEPPSHGHTTHLSVIDEAGNAVSMTLSLNGVFGSGVVAEGTGFVLNNHLLDFDTRDVIGTPSNGQTGPKNAPAPGKRPASASSPTIVVRNGKALLAVGAAGGPKILRGVPQAVINTIDFGMDVARAIDAERIFPANVSASPSVPDDGAVDVMDMEGARILQEVKDELARRGHRIANGSQEYSNLPTLAGVGTNLWTGKRLAYADRRAEHAAAMQSSPP